MPFTLILLALKLSPQHRCLSMWCAEPDKGSHNRVKVCAAGNLSDCVAVTRLGCRMYILGPATLPRSPARAGSFILAIPMITLFGKYPKAQQTFAMQKTNHIRNPRKHLAHRSRCRARSERTVRRPSNRRAAPSRRRSARSATWSRRPSSSTATATARMASRCCIIGSVQGSWGAGFQSSPES